MKHTMKRALRAIRTAAVAALLAVSPALLLPSCDEHNPIDVIQTEFGYAVTIEDIHLRDGVPAECVLRLTSGGMRGETVTVKVNYKVDDDLSLRVKVGGAELTPGAAVTLDASGQLLLELPELPEGRHTLHLVITNQYDKTFEKSVSFEVIRDKVFAEKVTAPAALRLEKGAAADTAVAIVPADADVLALGCVSSDEGVAKASLSGDGAAKTLHVEAVGDGAATVSLHHEDIQGGPAATVAVEVFSYKIEGLRDLSLVEGESATLTLKAEPSETVTLSSDDACVTVSSPTSSSGTWAVKAVSPGTATLTATAGRTVATATVAVTKKPETIALSPMSATIAQGQTKYFSVVSSADFTAELSSSDASITERTSAGVTVRNDNRAFRDTKVSLTVTNAADPTKKAVADILLEKKAETVTLTETISEAGRAFLSVGGENGGWTLAAAPSGVKAEVAGNTIVLTNSTYKAVSGVLTVKTKEQGVEASQTVTVKGLDIELTSLTLSPSTFSVQEGQSFSLALTAKYSDGTTKDVTEAASWTTSTNLQRNGSTFTGLQAGGAWVRATYGERSASIDGTVTAKPVTLSSLAIDPAYFNALVDESKVFSVTATMSDGAHRDVTRDCQWQVTGPATESGKGYYKMTDIGEVLIEASYTYDGETLTARSRGSVTKASGQVAGVSVEPKTHSMKIGETVSLTGEVRYSDGTTDRSGTFSVTPGGILTGADGNYAAVSAGVATVTYAYAGFSASATVTVAEGDSPDPGNGTTATVSQVVLNTASLTVYVGRDGAVTATAVMSDGTAKDVTGSAQWSSNNTAVATVDAYGRITGVKAGYATVTAMYEGKTATCGVTVEEEVTLASVGLTPASLSFTTGDPAKSVSAKAYYSDGTSKDVTNLAAWSTSDAAVASVSSGAVTPSATQGGSATITAKYQGLSGTCTVTVTKPEQSTTSVTLDATSIEITEGETYQIDGTVSLINPTATLSAKDACIWTTSSASVATVSQGLVTAKAAGTATITATHGGKSASCAVSVKAKPVQTTTSVTLTESSVDMTVGETHQLDGTVTCINPSRSYSARSVCTWSSSNSSVASVSSQGLVTAKAAGTATITASNGGKSATCTITVKDKPVTLSSIALNSTTLSLAVDATYTLPGDFKVTATFSDGTTKDVTSSVTWSVPSGSASYLSLSGLTLKGLKKTSSPAALTAAYTYSNEKKEASVAVTVTEKQAPTLTSVTASTSSIALTVGDAYGMTSGTKVRFEAKYSDGTTKDVTASATYAVPSNYATVAYLNGTTLIARATGTGQVTATYEGKSAAVAVTVTAKDVPVTSVALNKSSITLEEGASYTLSVTFNGGQSTPTNTGVTWTTTSAGIATVDGNGKVTGVAAGTCVVTVTTKDGGKTASCNVTVKKATVHVTGVAVSPTSTTVEAGKTVQLTATVTPSNADDRSVTWSSYDTSIATVDAYGKVTGVKAGTTTVYAESNDDGSKYGTCTVTVTAAAVAVTGVEIQKDGKKVTSLEVNTGTPVQLTAKVSPDNATNKAVTWSSSNSNVIEVSSTGLVSAKAAGTAKVTVMTQDGAKTATVDVTGKQLQYSISASPASLTWKYNESDERKITLTLTNVSAVKATLSSGSSYFNNPGLNGTTVTIKPKKANDDAADRTGRIRITDANNSNVYTDIDLLQQGKATPYVATMTLSPTSVTVKDSGTTSTLTLVAKDQYGSAIDASGVKWVSSDTKICTVDKGVVKGVGQGSAKVYATTSTNTDGKTVKSNEVAVTVEHAAVAVTGVTVSPTSKTLDVGGTVQLTATVSPSNADNKSVTWSSGNASVATVSSSGLVTAKAPGDVTITVKTADGGKTATCSIHVNSTVTSVSLNKTSVTFSNSGDKVTLIATPSPANADDDKGVTWDYNSSIFSLSKNGYSAEVSLTDSAMENPGDYTIKATIGSKSAECKATISAGKLTGHLLGQVEYSLMAGDEVVLKDTAKGKVTGTHYGGKVDADIPFTISEKYLSMTSSNTAVVTAGYSGGSWRLTGVAAGTATVTVVLKKGTLGYYGFDLGYNLTLGTMTVTVSSPQATTIKLDPNYDIILHHWSSGKVDSRTVSAKVYDQNGKEMSSPGTITWKSSNTAVVTVSPSSGTSTTATAVKGGTATVTATCGGKSSSIKVTVEDQDRIPVSIANETDVVRDGNWAFLPQFTVTYNDGTTVTFANIGTHDDCTMTVYTDFTGSETEVYSYDKGYWADLLGETGTVRFRAVLKANKWAGGTSKSTVSTKWYRFNAQQFEDTEDLIQ